MDITEAITTGDFELVCTLAKKERESGAKLDRNLLRDFLSDHNPYLPRYCEAALALIDMTPDLRNKRNEHSLFERALNTSQLEIVKAFVDRGISVKGRRTLLESFLTLHDVATEQIAITDYLISKGMNAEPDVLGRSLLELLANSPAVNNEAEDKNAVKLVNHLLELGADSNYQEKKGEQHCLLFEAVNTESLALVRLLIERGANPNAQTKRGFTPLMNACGTVYPATDGGVIYEPSALKNLIVKYLVEIGADTSIVANGKRTALSVAKSNDNWDAVDILSPDSKRRQRKPRLIDKSTLEIIHFLEEHEAETTAFMQNSSVNGAWPDDKQWLKERKEIWKYFVQPSIKELFMGNVRSKRYPSLRRFFVEGTKSADFQPDPLLETWLHANGSEENLEHVLDDHRKFS